MNSNVIPIRKAYQQTLADNPALWGLISAFADDDTHPLPRDPDSLVELRELLMEASQKVRLALVRVQEELMSG